MESVRRIFHCYTRIRRLNGEKMKRILQIALFILVSIETLAQVNLVKFTDSTYICEDHYYAKENSMVFIGPEYVTVIGATWTPKTAALLHEHILNVTSKPVKEIVNTNYHPDRAGGNEYWKSIGCEIHSTKMTHDLMKSDWQLIVNWTQRGISDYPDVELCLPSDTHAGDFELQDGRVKILYLGPSHTKDGVFVYFPEEKVLYGGCILKSFLGNLDQADLVEYPKTLKKLKTMNLEISSVISGHGRPIHDSGLIDHYLRLLKRRQNQNIEPTVKTPGE